MERDALITLFFIFIIVISGCVQRSTPANKPPHAEISAHEYCCGYPPLNVSFSLSAYDEDGYIVLWKVDCNGDGIYDYSGKGNLPNRVNYTYTHSGEYTAKFVVIDNKGSMATSIFPIIVMAPNESLSCFIDASPSSGYAPLVVTFSLNAFDINGYIVYGNLMEMEMA